MRRLPAACPALKRRAVVRVELDACWADSAFVRNAVCGQPADGELGLCRAHEKEIIG